MKQFTMNIDDGLLQAAKMHALERGRTVSDIVRGALSREVGWQPSIPRPPVDDNAVRTALLKYAEGALSRRQAMEEIGLSPDRYPEFVEEMIRTGTQWPPLNKQRVAEESEVVARAISEALDED